jgi:hypothetical protein
LPSKTELLKKIDEVGLEKLTDFELRRVKKLITKESIKEAHALIVEEDE